MSFDINAIMRQAQKMQQKMEKVQEELANEKIDYSTGGGMVKCTVSGAGEVLSITINPEAMTEDVTVLEDMILVAVREALAKAQALQQERMHGLTGGMNTRGRILTNK